MDKPSEAIAEATVSSAQESLFPYDGIFSPHGFLSTISASTSEDRGEGASGKVDGQYEDQGQGQLPAMKKLKTQTTSKRVTKVMPKVDLSPSQVAFGIDLIFENILYFLDTSDLLKCRFVCRRWRIIATSELQKTVELVFTDDLLSKDGYRVYSRFELRQLTRLLRQKSEISRSRFPCQKFEFFTSWDVDQRTIRSTQLRNFLDVYGIHIRSLHIRGYFALINENVALAEIRELVIKQTPKLKKFSIGVETSKGDDPESILDTESRNEDAFEIKSMKTLRIYTNSMKVFQGIIQLAPNVEELVHYQGSYQDRYFRKELSSLHLLKKMDLDLDPRKIKLFEKIVKASVFSPGTLKLKRIAVDARHEVLWGEVSGNNVYVSYSRMERRLVLILNHLLDCSWDTLETIIGYNLTFLSGIEWRQVMPKVKSLKLMFRNYVGSNERNRVAKIFPSERGLSTIFPKLRLVEIIYCSADDEESNFIEFLNRLSPEDEEVINSVKDVRVRAYSNHVAPSTELLDRLRKLFPKAEIQYPCPVL